MAKSSGAALLEQARKDRHDRLTRKNTSADVNTSSSIDTRSQSYSRAGTEQIHSHHHDSTTKKMVRFHDEIIVRKMKDNDHVNGSHVGTSIKKGFNNKKVATDIILEVRGNSSTLIRATLKQQHTKNMEQSINQNVHSLAATYDVLSTTTPTTAATPTTASASASATSDVGWEGGQQNSFHGSEKSQLDATATANSGFSSDNSLSPLVGTANGSPAVFSVRDFMVQHDNPHGLVLNHSQQHHTDSYYSSSSANNNKSLGSDGHTPVTTSVGGKANTGYTFGDVCIDTTTTSSNNNNSSSDPPPLLSVNGLYSSFDALNSLYDDSNGNDMRNEGEMGCTVSHSFAVSNGNGNGNSNSNSNSNSNGSNAGLSTIDVVGTPDSPGISAMARDMQNSEIGDHYVEEGFSSHSTPHSVRSDDLNPNNNNNNNNTTQSFSGRRTSPPSTCTSVSNGTNTQKIGYEMNKRSPTSSVKTAKSPKPCWNSSVRQQPIAKSLRDSNFVSKIVRGNKNYDSNDFCNGVDRSSIGSVGDSNNKQFSPLIMGNRE